jgi:hypothetical protein
MLENSFWHNSFLLLQKTIMKKALITAAFMLGIGVCAIHAQETKTKPVTTPTDKVHNVTHPHNKVSHGEKTKTKTATGKKHVTTEKTTKPEALEPKKKTEKKS